MILDLLFAAVLIISIFVGLKYGFAQSVFGFASTFLSIVLAYIFYEPFRTLLMSFEFFVNIHESIMKNVAKYITPSVQSSNTLPGFIPKNAIQSGMNNAAQGTSGIIADIVMGVIIIVIFIVLVKIIMKVIGLVLGLIVKLPVVKQFDGLLGGMFGALNGLMLCYLAAAIVFLVIANSEAAWLSGQLQNSYASAYFYKNNLVINLLMTMSK